MLLVPLQEACGAQGHAVGHTPKSMNTAVPIKIHVMRVRVAAIRTPIAWEVLNAGRIAKNTPGGDSTG